MRRRVHRMNKTIKAIVYERHGNPAEVLQIKAEPWPQPAVDEAIVAMRAAPINPADINAIEGKYPGRREVPAVPGFEGAGVVVEVGANVSTIAKGALVILPHNIGTWREAIRLGLNAVGGESALRLANCLAFGGTLVSFGAMSLQPLKIPTGLLIFKDLRFRGIWINKWYDNATMQERMEAFKSLFDMARRGLLKTKVEKAYSIDDAQAAVAHAAQSKRRGKIIFEFNA